MSNKYCDQHWPGAAKISKKPVILDDLKGTGTCDWAGCGKNATVKLRYYKNPPESAAAIV